MHYDLVGIDTIKFTVSTKAFNKWLKSKGLFKVKVADTLLTSRTLIKRVAKEPFVRVVRLNDSYGTKLSNYLIVTQSITGKRKQHYQIELAGLHQPTNGGTHINTLRIINELVKKYDIKSVDYAMDFLAHYKLSDPQVVANLLHSEFTKRVQSTYYYDIGADYSGEEPMGSSWMRDSLLYWKYMKEKYKHTEKLEELWYRLELRVDNNESMWRKLDVEIAGTVIKSNKSFLEWLRGYIEPAMREMFATLSQTNHNYELLEVQIKQFTDARALRYVS